MNDIADTATPETPNPDLVNMANAYALIIRNDNQVEIVTPLLEDNAPLTDGHLLMLGMSMLLRQPGWATEVIEQTAKVLTEARDQHHAAETPTEG